METAVQEVQEAKEVLVLMVAIGPQCSLTLVMQAMAEKAVQVVLAAVVVMAFAYLVV